MVDPLADCQERLGYQFTRIPLLERALTHASRRTEGEVCNERLEFLGDSILGMVIAEYLFRELPDFAEGDLTLVKSVAVSTRSLATATTRIGLESFVRVGRGISDTQKLSARVLANMFEAVVAAIYLDGGIEPSRAFILRQLERTVNQVLHDRHRKNWKSLLQQYAQKHMSTTPTYRLLAEEGPEHGKQFQLCAVIGEREFEPAWGQNKKDAEQEAAHNALKMLTGAD